MSINQSSNDYLTDGPISTMEMDQTHNKESMLRRITVAASVGSLIEYFDLAVYGAFASVMAKVFFPGADDTADLLNTFAVFAVAFVARPLGGLFWGPLGDRIGRKRTLAAIIIIMALATAAIGLLPSHAAIGTLAPLALVVLRFVQGISAGGEIPGAATFVAEHTHTNKRALQTSFLMWGVSIGQLAGLLVATVLFSVLSAEDMQSWGWRVPFLLGLPLGAIGLYIRSRVSESPEFLKVEQTVAKANPLKAILGNAQGLRMLGKALLFTLPMAFTGYMLLTYMPAYLTKSLHLTSGDALLAVSAAMIVAMILQPVAGRLSDRIGRRRMLLTVCLTELALALPAFALLQSGHGDGGALLPSLGLILLGVVHGAGTGTQSAPTLESFPTRYRYTGFALALGLVAALLSGPTPYIATWLVAATGNGYAPAWLLMASVIPPIIGFFFIKETANRPLPS
ncbi:MFS transporter [Arthrobacter sp. NPDC056493]|uniref:MFS transporter n=1 Tax=Arthrobacter sp. NPDC056493 TaxID=3345839 RepID=UPI003671D70E